MQELDFKFIGQRIKEVRNEKHLTQEYLARVTDVNVSHISNIETNKVRVSLTLLIGICNALGITLDYLLENELSDVEVEFSPHGFYSDDTVILYYSPSTDVITTDAPTEEPEPDYKAMYEELKTEYDELLEKYNELIGE